MWRLLSAPTAAAAPDADTSASDAAAAPVEVRRGWRVAVAQQADNVWLGYLGGAACVKSQNASHTPIGKSAQKKPAVSGTVHLQAPMAGRIVALHSKPLAPCRKGDTLIVMEAMKMEYRVCAPADGHIVQLLVAPGAAVAMDASVAVFVCDAHK